MARWRAVSTDRWLNILRLLWEKHGRNKQKYCRIVNYTCSLLYCIVVCNQLHILFKDALVTVQYPTFKVCYELSMYKLINIPDVSNNCFSTTNPGDEFLIVWIIHHIKFLCLIQTLVDLAMTAHKRIINIYYQFEQNLNARL